MYLCALRLQHSPLTSTARLLQDLLWRYHVGKEDKQEQINVGDRLPSNATVKRRQERMVMGMTGTLIPDITPRQSSCLPLAHQQSVLYGSGTHTLLASASGTRLQAASSATRSQASRGDFGARKTAESVRSSASSSTHTLVSSSSTRSLVRLQDVQEILESQSRLLREKTDEELRSMRSALHEEARKREDAERKIQFLCEKLGIHE